MTICKTFQGISCQNTQSTGRGSTLVNETSEFFSTLVQNLQGIHRQLNTSAAGLQEHSTGIEQISNSIQQLDAASNKNAALAEELSATAESMDANSNHLNEIVRQFIVDSQKDDKTPSTSPSPDMITVSETELKNRELAGFTEF